MNKLSNLITSGSCLIGAGVVMLLSEKIGVQNAKIIVPLLFAIAGVFIILFAKDNKQFKVGSLFYSVQGFGMLIFAILIAFLPKNLNEFLIYVTSFLMVYGFIEIMFIFSVLNSDNKLRINIVIYRLLGGAVSAIGALVILLTSFKDPYKALMISGVLIIIGGVTQIIFASKIQKLNLQKHE